MFYNCLTAIQMIWDWGFNWQRVEIDGGAIGWNISGIGGIDGQGVGSISIIGELRLERPLIGALHTAGFVSDLSMNNAQIPRSPIVPLAS